MNCSLCEKVQSRVISADEVVWEFPRSVALLGPWQYYTGYCIVVARRHVDELFDLDNAELHVTFGEMIVVARAIAACFKPRKINYEMLGNHVAHPHWHIFPRRADDPESLKAVWLAIDRAERDPTERVRLRAGLVPRAEIVHRLQRQIHLQLGDA
jgi:diadenosine tetraphosphate (Ap4A) HIT family hydrolase